MPRDTKRHQETEWDNQEKLWNLMRHHETPWNLMRHQETLWNLMKPHETPWSLTRHCETSRDTVKSHETPWDIMKPHETPSNSKTPRDMKRHHEIPRNEQCNKSMFRIIWKLIVSILHGFTRKCRWYVNEHELYKASTFRLQSHFYFSSKLAWYNPFHSVFSSM